MSTGGWGFQNFWAITLIRFWTLRPGCMYFRNKWMKYLSDPIGNPTLDFPACSEVPQLTATPRTPQNKFKLNEFFWFEIQTWRYCDFVTIICTGRGKNRYRACLANRCFERGIKKNQISYQVSIVQVVICQRLCSTCALCWGQRIHWFVCLQNFSVDLFWEMFSDFRACIVVVVQMLTLLAGWPLADFTSARK